MRGEQPRLLIYLMYNLFLIYSTAILVLYLSYYLGFNEDTSTALYHTFIVLCYATPLLGAIIADSLLGKYKLVDCITVAHIKILTLSCSHDIWVVKFDSV